MGAGTAAIAARTGRAREIQENICPFWPIEHFTILGDNLTYELVIDALTYVGAARPGRLTPPACAPEGG